jgi:UDP-N-acetylglucosamine acyltransferase
MLHPTAIVHPGAEIGKYSEIGPYCIVGEHVSIGARTILQAHVVVNGWTQIGDDCQLYPFSTVGAASQDRKYAGERAFTRVGSRTILREYVSIQRATGRDELTAVGDDCLLLAYVHIAHNCILGNGVTMSNLAQLAGHVNVGDYVTIGGQTGIHQFTRVGRHAMVGGMSKLTKDVPPFFLVEGNPCQPYGLNSVGLRRAAFPVEERQEIKRFYKLLYDPKLNVSQAIEAMKAEVTTDAGREIVAFLEAPSERGVLK